MSDQHGHYHDTDTGQFASPPDTAEERHSTEFVSEDRKVAYPSLEGRNPAVLAVFRWLIPNEKLPAAQYALSQECHDLALQMIQALPDDPELTVGLRKLLEAKDCFVRASLA
jgi:hypothetical protein